ncbi:MAG: hypothetical protein HYU64_19345 [Armatimonadetes bacterium]|nr:hypothetical protein [Armatimonadota bacterium]
MNALSAISTGTSQISGNQPFSFAPRGEESQPRDLYQKAGLKPEYHDNGELIERTVFGVVGAAVGAIGLGYEAGLAGAVIGGLVGFGAGFVLGPWGLILLASSGSHGHHNSNHC